ncbi:hypothetical protein Lal_00002734 [Lupinus albus]|nr:hypothetical protein Lal_00002734 [Lupinus albus]
MLLGIPLSIRKFAYGTTTMKKGDSSPHQGVHCWHSVLEKTPSKNNTLQRIFRVP